MAATQPVSRVVNVAVQLTPAAAQSQALNTLMYLSTQEVVDVAERIRTYPDIGSVAADFGTTADEYKAALRWFAQSPKPVSFMIGRRALASTPAMLKGAVLTPSQQALANFTAINAGSFSWTSGGLQKDATGVNLSTATSLPSAAALINTRLNALFPGTAVTVTWNSVYGRFEFVSPAVGGGATMSFLIPNGGGQDLSALLGGQAAQGGYTVPGAAAETVVAALATMDDQFGQRFYGVGLPPGTINADVLAAAAYVEAAGPKHVLFFTTQDAGVLVTPTTTDIAYLLKAAGYKRTFVQYSGSAPNAAMSAAARILGVNYEGGNTTITLKFKQEPGVVAENLPMSQALAAEAKNCNLFIAYENGTAILEQGVMSSGDFTDIITGADWLATTIQRDVWNLLYSSNTKIPQTDDGATLIQATVEARCAQAVTNGLAAPGVWNAGGFGTIEQGDYLPKGYYVYIQPMRTQAQADRAARKCPPIQVALKLAGAVHSADVTININQ